MFRELKLKWYRTNEFVKDFRPYPKAVILILTDFIQFC